MRPLSLFLLPLLLFFSGPCFAVELATTPAEPVGLVTAILVALLALSEVLAFIPAVRANSVFRLITGVVRKLLGR